MVLAARRRGIDSSVCWMPGPAAEPGVFDAAGGLGVRVEAVPAERTRGLSRMAREFGAMLRREMPDGLIINACGRPGFWMLPWLARRAGVPAIWVHHMVDACDHRRLAPRRLGGRVEGLQCWRLPQTLRHRLAGAAATAVVALNTADRERIARWQRLRRERIAAIAPGVDCERFRFDPAGRRRWHREWNMDALSPAPFVVGTAGRLSREKGVDVLIEAVAVARREGLPVLAAVAGQGSEEEALKRLAVDRGVVEVVRFASFVEDMPAFYSALDVFVLTSRTESFGLALAEAMACARVAAATPTAGAMRQIRHLHNGWQLRSFEPAELARALATLAADAGARARMGEAARESVVRRFNIDLTLERTLRALRGYCDGRSGLHRSGMSEPVVASPVAEDGA